MQTTRYIQFREGLPLRNWHPLMTSLDIELSERCNNNCLHCCINQPEQNRRCQEMELQTAVWKDLLVQAAALGVLRIRFTGGEPLLREDFAELYTFTRRLGIRILLFTNARLITPHLADLFVRIPPGEDIEVTAYGLSADTYEMVSRKPGW